MTNSLSRQTRAIGRTICLLESQRHSSPNKSSSAFRVRLSSRCMKQLTPWHGSSVFQVPACMVVQATLAILVSPALVFLSLALAFFLDVVHSLAVLLQHQGTNRARPSPPLFTQLRSGQSLHRLAQAWVLSTHYSIIVKIIFGVGATVESTTLGSAIIGSNRACLGINVRGRDRCTRSVLACHATSRDRNLVQLLKAP